MKNLTILLMIILSGSIITSCGDKNNDPVPSTLDQKSPVSQTDPGFKPIEIRIYASDNIALSANSLMAVTFSTDSINFSHAGSANGFLRTKTSSCAEPSGGLKLPISNKGKIYLKVTTTNHQSSTSFTREETHFATLNVSHDGTMTLSNYPQKDNHNTRLNHCAVNDYRITFHYPLSKYND